MHNASTPRHVAANVSSTNGNAMKIQRPNDSSIHRVSCCNQKSLGYAAKMYVKIIEKKPNNKQISAAHFPRVEKDRSKHEQIWEKQWKRAAGRENLRNSLKFLGEIN